MDFRCLSALPLAQGWEAIAYDLAGHGQSQPYNRFFDGQTPARFNPPAPPLSDLSPSPLLP
jgi:pimeloyl-ACP methyl ester carboxylesterase